MEYSYKPNLLQSVQRIRLTEESLEVLNGKGVVKRSVPLTSVRQLQEFDFNTISDSQGNRFNVKICTISASGARSISLKSANHTGPSSGDDQRRKYDRFVGALMDRLKVVQPDVRIVSGSSGAVVAMYMVAALGCLLVPGALFIANEALSRADPAGGLQLAGVCAVTGVGIATVSFRLARRYVPASTTLRERDTGSAST
ncbi:MAG: hypothetical protein Fues2KO_48990 [Fuerstiella sp.]